MRRKIDNLDPELRTLIDEYAGLVGGLPYRMRLREVVPMLSDLSHVVVSLANEVGQMKADLRAQGMRFADDPDHDIGKK